MGKGIVKVGIYQSHELFVLLYDDAFSYVRQVVQLVFYFFGVDVLPVWTEEHILVASFDGDIAFGIHQGKVAGVQPTVFVHNFGGSLFILVVAQHDVGTAADNLAGDILRIGRKNLHFHARSGFSAGTGFEARPVFVTDDRTAFCHTVTHGIGEVYHAQELFHLLVECRTADNDCGKIAAECLYHLLAYGGFYLVVNDRYFQQQFHGRRFQLGQYTLLDNLFDNERYGYDEVRLYVGECLEDNLRTWHTGEVVDVATYGELVQEFECQSVHMSHRQHAYQFVAGFQRQYFESESGVGPQAAIGEHYAFRVTGSTGSIVNDRQLFGLVFVIVDVFLTEVLGKFLAEYLVEVIAGVGNPFVARYQQGEVRHHEDTFEQRHGAFVEIFPHLVADKKKLGLGVVDDVMHIVRLEFVKNGHDDRTIRQGSEESDSPMRTVTSADGDFIAFSDAARFKDDMQFFYFAGYILVLQGGSLIIGQGIQVPVFLYTILYIGDKTLFHYILHI